MGSFETERVEWLTARVHALTARVHELTNEIVPLQATCEVLKNVVVALDGRVIHLESAAPDYVMAKPPRTRRRRRKPRGGATDGA